jgi:hypothetical protein
MKAKSSLTFSYNRSINRVTLSMSHEEFEDWAFALEMAVDEENEQGNIFEKRSLARARKLLKEVQEASNKMGPSPELEAQNQRAMAEVTEALKKVRKHQ